MKLVRDLDHNFLPLLGMERLPKPLPLINQDDWPSRRPDGQTANAEPQPAPTVKGSSVRPGTDKITVRVPTQKARKFKLLCRIHGWEQKEVIENLLDQWFQSLGGRPDGQTATSDLIDRDLISNPDQKIDDEAGKFLPSSSSLALSGRPDGQQSLAAKRQAVLAYYVRFTGNPIRQNDLDFLETIIEYPLHVIQSGIAQSVYGCKTPLHDPHVGSLRYCEGAIEEVAEAGVGAEYLRHLEDVLRRVANGWEGRKLTLPPGAFPPKQPALPSTGAGELEDLNSRKETE